MTFAETKLITNELIKSIGSIQNSYFEKLDLSLVQDAYTKFDPKHLENKLKEYSDFILHKVNLFHLSLWIIKPSLFRPIFLFISVYDENNNLITTDLKRPPQNFSSYKNIKEAFFNIDELNSAAKFYSILKTILQKHKYTKIYISILELINALRESSATRSISSFINALEMLLTNYSKYVRKKLTTRINHILNSKEYSDILNIAYDIRSEYYHGTSLGEKKIKDLNKKSKDIIYDFEKLIRLLYRTILNNEKYFKIVTNDYYSGRQPEWKSIDRQNK